MKEIEIDEAYSIKHDGVCWHLIHRQVKKRERPDKDGRWGKGDTYITNNKTYYPTIKMALKYYLNDSLSSSKTILEVLNRIDEVESKIDGLKIVVK